MFVRSACHPFGRIHSTAFAPDQVGPLVPGRLAGMGHWVYVFSGCPDSGDYQQIADDEEPGHAVLRERQGGLCTVDGFVRESIGDLMKAAHFRWVAGGARPWWRRRCCRLPALHPHAKDCLASERGQQPRPPAIPREGAASLEAAQSCCAIPCSANLIGIPPWIPAFRRRKSTPAEQGRESRFAARADQHTRQRPADW